MDRRKELLLPSDARLVLDGERLVSYDKQGNEIRLTVGQQKMLTRLAREYNHTVPMADLYEAYTGLAGATEIAANIAKMKNTFPQCIKEAIRSERGCGYRLEGELKTADEALSVRHASGEKTGQFSDLAGDYYGFYLDRLGNRSVLGAYLHIENAGTADEHELTACAVLNIRSENAMFGGKIAEIFSQTGRDYKNAFQRVKSSFNPNDRRCSWGQGTVCADGALADLTLKINDTGARWKILLDMTEYLRCGRGREQENDCYRGGLGIVLASRTIHGTYCFRLGLVRKTLLQKPIPLNNDTMKDMLKISDDSRDALWKPMKLSGLLDKRWYEWFMNNL
ncbi:MAG: hypothetical protein IJY28_01895 [Clostridia bacterium]|nr:hypothetical protein [Clostridia bacterium]